MVNVVLQETGRNSRLSKSLITKNYSECNFFSPLPNRESRESLLQASLESPLTKEVFTSMKNAGKNFRYDFYLLYF